MIDWSKIIEQYGPLMWRTAYRLLRNEADAADSVQRALLSAHKLSEKESVQNWPGLLQRLTTVRSLDLLRERIRQSNRSESGGPRIEILIDSKIGSPDELAASHELADQLRIALTRIDSRQAQVFCLMSLEGLNDRDVAEQLNIKASHARVLLGRARDALREKMKAYAPLNFHTNQGTHAGERT